MRFSFSKIIDMDRVLQEEYGLLGTSEVLSIFVVLLHWWRLPRCQGLAKKIWGLFAGFLMTGLLVGQLFNRLQALSANVLFGGTKRLYSISSAP